MPIGVPLQSIPSQNFTITLDGNLFEITIKETAGVMAVSLVINGVDTIDNLIAASGAPIIPAQYLEAGNFMFLTANNQLPYYTQFNVTQSLFYFTAAELASFRTAPVPPVTATFFNPVGELPWRFAPRGYVKAP